MAKTLTQRVAYWTQELYSRPEAWSMGLLMHAATSVEPVVGQALADFFTANRPDVRLVGHDRIEPGHGVLRDGYEWPFQF